MKIALISDLHVDINDDYPVIETVAERAKEADADALVIAGDISECYEQTLREMDKLAGLCDFPVRYVPGNHDMWNVVCRDKSTDEIYAAYRSDPLCLSGKSLTLPLDGKRAEADADAQAAPALTILGDIGWYEGAFANPKYSREELDAMRLHNRVWQDKFFNDWTQDNPGTLAWQLKALSDAIDAVPEGNRIMAVTHMVPVRDFTVPEQWPDWDFFNAFLGSPAIGELFDRRRVDYGVCGHVHFRRQAERGRIRYYCACLGYCSEWKLYRLEDDGVKAAVRHAMQFAEV